MSKTVCVQGLGFVGFAMAVAVANARDSQTNKHEMFGTVEIKIRRYHPVNIDAPIPPIRFQVRSERDKQDVDCVDFTYLWIIPAAQVYALHYITEE